MTSEFDDMDGFLAADPEIIRAERNKAQELRNSQWWKNLRGQGKCHYCGKQVPPKELTMDHLIPLARGGRSTKSNIVPCCKDCNSKKKYLLPTEAANMASDTTSSITERIYNLIVKTATQLPTDIAAALCRGRACEEPGSTAESTLDTMMTNAEMAADDKLPICQDTGAITFFVDAPPTAPVKDIEECAAIAIRKATANGILRPNCVDAITGKNSGDNLGAMHPVFHWHLDTSATDIRITAMLKGGGSENMSRQYSLPDASIGAGRDLDGVRRCLLDAVVKIQGRGCAPGILGVCIGGDRAGGYETAKMQLLRPVGDRNPDATIADLENRILEEANQLGIGPMGLGGNTTLLDVFIAPRHRHPACFFVTVAYCCWCCRRQTITL